MKWPSRLVRAGSGKSGVRGAGKDLELGSFLSPCLRKRKGPAPTAREGEGAGRDERGGAQPPPPPVAARRVPPSPAGGEGFSLASVTTLSALVSGIAAMMVLLRRAGMIGYSSPR